VEQQAAAFPESTKSYDTWDDFMLRDWCRFHEHAEDGKCWRSTEEGPEMDAFVHFYYSEKEKRQHGVNVDLSDVAWF
jgi:hypothetical protein